MRVTLEHLSDVIGSIYEAGLDETRWRETARQIARTTGGFAGALVLWDTAAGKYPVAHSAGWPDGTFEEYGQHYVNVDPKGATFRARPDIEIYTDAMLVAPEVKRKHEYFDWERRASEQHFGFGARVFAGNGFETTLIMGRTHTQGEAEEEHLKPLSLLLPHLRRGVAMGRKIGEEFTKQTLDTLSFGVVVLDYLGGISVLNAAADQMARENDGFKISQRGISLATPSDNAALERVIGQFRNALYFAIGNEPRRLTAARPSGKRPYHLAVYPLSRRQSVVPFGGALMVCIVDPNQSAHIQARTLCDLHGLSPAEAQLTLALVQLGSLAAAARHCGITDGSARQYLKRVFAKTETSGQVDLVATVLKSLRV